MSRRGVCLFLAVILAFLLQGGAVAASASSLEPEESIQPNTESGSPANEDLFAAATEPETAEEIIPADFPALTVDVISNFFPSAHAEYSASKKEITVTYWLHMSKDLLTTQWYVSYDPEVLTASPEKNTAEFICPAIGRRSVISFGEKDKIRCSASSVALFDFSSEMTPFVKLVFDVNELDPDEPATTKIDLTVDVLRVSEKNEQTGMSDPEKESLLVCDSSVVPSEGLISVGTDKTTTLTKSSFVQATHDEPGESSSLEEPSTGGSPATDPSASAPVVDPDDPGSNGGRNTGAVGTGSPGFALIAFGFLFVATGALFVMRKKGILY